MNNLVISTIIILIVLVNSSFVILAKNPIHSLLFLVITFFFCSLFLICINCEFLAMLFLIVYIGALIVLFLFIIMMLNIKLIELEGKIINYLPIALYIIIAFVFELIFILNKKLDLLTFSFYDKDLNLFNLNLNNFFFINDNYLNITAVSDLLFTKYASMFIIAGMILLVAMIGSIILTLNNKTHGVEQNIYKQINQKYTLRKIKLKYEE